VACIDEGVAARPAFVALLQVVRYTAVPHAKWHPFHKLAMKNDPDWPIVTWVVARK